MLDAPPLDLGPSLVPHTTLGSLSSALPDAEPRMRRPSDTAPPQQPQPTVTSAAASVTLAVHDGTDVDTKPPPLHPPVAHSLSLHSGGGRSGWASQSHYAKPRTMSTTSDQLWGVPDDRDGDDGGSAGGGRRHDHHSRAGSVRGSVVGSVSGLGRRVGSYTPIVIGHSLGTGGLHKHSTPVLQLLSVTVLPPDLKVNLGGMIASRSVKYLGKLHTNVRAL